MNEPFDRPIPAKRPPDDEHWARDLMREAAFAHVVEKRRARRWGIFFKLLFLAYLVGLLLLWHWPLGRADLGLGRRHTAMVTVEGLITADAEAGAKNVIEGLRAAFKDGNTAGVILWINSPGGSPVQAGEMYEEIMRLRRIHPEIPIYAVAGDICASGGYYVAAAAQKIYANKASIIGSIGVRSDGFGFVDAMQKLGISRRLYTAGQNKGFLDPFEPVRPDDVRHLEGILNEVHQQFIQAVRDGRSGRLREAPELFSGLVWTGAKGVELGLVDELADIRYVAEEVIGAEKIVDYTRQRPLFERLLTTGVESGLRRALARALGEGDSLR